MCLLLFIFWIDYPNSWVCLSSAHQHALARISLYNVVGLWYTSKFFTISDVPMVICVLQGTSASRSAFAWGTGSLTKMLLFELDSLVKRAERLRQERATENRRRSSCVWITAGWLQLHRGPPTRFHLSRCWSSRTCVPRSLLPNAVPSFSGTPTS